MKAHLLVVLGLALGLVILVFLAASGPVSWAQPACQRYVAYEGDDGTIPTINDCSDEGKPCASVQHAINQSSTGDRICVSSVILNPDPTVYSETITIDLSVILDGAWESMCTVHTGCTFQRAEPCAADRVVIHAEGAGPVITMLDGVEPTIDCFTITGGNADTLLGEPDGQHTGGGIYGAGASPIIVNNIITGNFGCDACPTSNGYGGGIYLYKTPATTLIANNLIANNVADNVSAGQGGGIVLRESDAVVEQNEIRYNRSGLSAGSGGGIAVVDGEPTIRDNEVHHNVAGQSVMGLGGGIYVRSGKAVRIEGNILYDNQAITGPGDASLISKGGGIYIDGDPTVHADIWDNDIGRNVASPVSHRGHGGGIYATGLVTPSLIAANNVEANVAGELDNGWGGGIYLDGSEAILQGNEIWNNTATGSGSMGRGGGILVEGGTVTVRGNALARNTGGRDVASSMGFGGGMVLSDTIALVQDNLITGNRGTNSPDFAAGGGAYVFTSTVRIVGNTIVENSLTSGPAGYGGGLYLHYSASTVDGNTVTDNKAGEGPDGRGGGVRLASCPAFTLTNNIIARNHTTAFASGVGVAESMGWIAHNTIADNTGGDGSGIHVWLASTATVYGNIILGHTVGITNADAPASTVQAEYTLFEANTNDYGPDVTSLNEIPGPALLLPDFHLATGSGAINRVLPVPWVAWDIDGDARPTSVWSDAGADERDDVPLLKCYLPLVLRAAP